MREKSCTVPVYLDGQSRGKPYTRVSLETAREWVRDGIARLTSKRGRSLTLYARKLVRLRGQSCSITVHILIEAICGSRYHQGLIAGWA